MSLIATSAGLVPVQSLCGWGVKHDDGSHAPGPTARLISAVAARWDQSPEDFPNVFKSLHVVGAAPSKGRSMLWEVVRKVLGQDTRNYAQLVGDCVSFGAKNAGEYLQCCQLLLGNLATFTPLFPPYLWGCGRIFEGNNQLGRQDGSTGIWQAVAVMKYGVVPSAAKLPNGEVLPEYSAAVARKWGNLPGPGQEWVALGKTHLVKATAKVATTQALRVALDNLYPVTVASDVGYQMTPAADGFHHPEGEWGHQMCVIGYDDNAGTGTPPCFCILNSWGDVHGHLADFRDPAITWPVGTLRVPEAAMQAMLDAQDSYAYSSFQDFPGQEIGREMFDPF